MNSYTIAEWKYTDLFCAMPKIVSEYDQEIPQSQTADNPNREVNAMNDCQV